VAALFESLHNLAQLSLRGCAAVSDEGIQRIAESPVVWGPKRRTFPGLLSLSVRIFFSNSSFSFSYFLML
jgi:hypothetical protein